MKKEKFSINKRLASFKFAFNGIRILLKEEHNSRIHFLAAFCVIALAYIFKISSIEWIALIFVIGFVIVVEIINTSIENIADFISPEKNEKIKVIKDLAAAAVLVSAITSMIIGLIVFVPRLWTYL